MFLVSYRRDVVDKGFVLQVTDGDGCILQSGDGTHVVRLYGIDAPERNQEWGIPARDFLKRLIEHKEVTFRRHERDCNGRLVADLELEDVGRVSVVMVREGFAWWYKRFAFRDRELREAEKEARADRRGLWGNTKPVPPWLWRHRRVRIAPEIKD